MGAPPESSSPTELTAFLRSEIKKFAEVVQIAGAKID
jgi:tripartite-type tricarboxylate transporter receptor subunit TctC